MEFITEYDFELKKWSVETFTNSDEVLMYELKNLEKESKEIYIYNTETEAIETACVDYLKAKINKNE